LPSRVSSFLFLTAAADVQTAAGQQHPKLSSDCLPSSSVPAEDALLLQQREKRNQFTLDGEQLNAAVGEGLELDPRLRELG
jgi:hypothetical protein